MLLLYRPDGIVTTSDAFCQIASTDCSSPQLAHQVRLVQTVHGTERPPQYPFPSQSSPFIARCGARIDSAFQILRGRPCSVDISNPRVPDTVTSNGYDGAFIQLFTTAKKDLFHQVDAVCCRHIWKTNEARVALSISEQQAAEVFIHRNQNAALLRCPREK